MRQLVLHRLCRCELLLLSRSLAARLTATDYFFHFSCSQQDIRRTEVLSGCSKERILTDLKSDPGNLTPEPVCRGFVVIASKPGGSW